MGEHLQATLKDKITFTGIGLHKGKPVSMTLYPAPADHGIWFERTDITDRNNRIPATYDRVTRTDLCTVIGNEDGIKVSTVEHIMAALAGTGIFNVRIEIDRPEVPIMDGSAEQFVQKILRVGVKQLDAPIRAIRILKPVSVAMDNDVTVSLSPSDAPEIDFHIDFPSDTIGKQTKSLNMANGTFVRELSLSRTFVRDIDIPKIRERGLGLGGSLQTTLVISDEKGVLNPGGFRQEDECVRHKILDAFGDMALAGAPILGRFSGFKAGHTATIRLLHELFATPDAWDVVICDDAMNNLMPGFHIMLDDLRRDSDTPKGSDAVLS